MSLREFVETKERATAWAFRILITLVGATSTAVLWMGWSTLVDVRAKSETSIQLQWTAIGKITDSQTQLSNQVAVIGTKMDDHIKAENDIDTQLKDITKDQEQRLRHMEQVPH